MATDVHIAAVAGLVLLTGCGQSLDDAPGAAVAYEGAGAVCEVPVPIAELSPALYEASGITRDPRQSDLFWAHNDSGNAAELFAVDAEGRLRAVVPIVGATDRDLEDIAVGPCPSGNCLYLADIGDNFAVHQVVAVHRLPLPPLPPGPRGDANDAAAAPATLPAIRPDVSWSLVYPGGARDAESLVVDSARAELVILTKGREGYAEIYSIGLDALESGPGPHELKRVGPLPVPMGAHTSQYLTAADLSPDGSRLAVRSYIALFEFDWEGSAAFDSLAVPAASTLIPALEPQGEGVTWTNDGESLMLISEGRSSRLPSLSSMRCPVDRSAEQAEDREAEQAASRSAEQPEEQAEAAGSSSLLP